MYTFNQLIQRAIQRLSMVNGTSVQTYAEDLIGEMIQHKFDVLFDMRWWPEYSDWVITTLDGVLGLPTTDFSTVSMGVKRFDDIRVVFHENSRTPLPKLPRDVDPYAASYNQAMFIEPISDRTRLFRVWPMTATGTLRLHVRKKPNAFVPNDVVYLDDQALILGAVYDYLEDDGTNPNATQKFQKLYEDRVKQLLGNAHEEEIALTPRNGTILTEWS